MVHDVADTSLLAPSEGCTAYIVGPNHFQNTMLATYIETHSKGRSAVYESIAAIPSDNGVHSRDRSAVLYDCFGKQAGEFPKTLLAELENLPGEWALALFNLDRHAGIEKTALEFGVQGFFYTDDAVETLLKGLAMIFGGEFWVSRQYLAQIALGNSFGLRRRQMLDHVYPHDLTSREVEILGLLTLGASNDVISDKLFISPNTVRTHLSHIFRKIRVTSRLQAAHWAMESLFCRRYD